MGIAYEVIKPWNRMSFLPNLRRFHGIGQIPKPPRIEKPKPEEHFHFNLDFYNFVR